MGSETARSWFDWPVPSINSGQALSLPNHERVKLFVGFWTTKYFWSKAPLTATVGLRDSLRL